MTFNHVGLHGLDPVALLGHSRRIQGRPNFKSYHRGKIYLFSTQLNLEIFQINPLRFLPQLDGYCPLTYALYPKPSLGWAHLLLARQGQIFLCSSSIAVQLCRLCPWILGRAQQRYLHIQVELDDIPAA